MIASHTTPIQNGSHSYSQLKDMMRLAVPVSLIGLDGLPYITGNLTSIENLGGYAVVSLKGECGTPYSKITVSLSYSTADERPIRIQAGSPREPRPTLLKWYAEGRPVRVETPSEPDSPLPLPNKPRRPISPLHNRLRKMRKSSLV